MHIFLNNSLTCIILRYAHEEDPAEWKERGTGEVRQSTDSKQIPFSPTGSLFPFLVNNGSFQSLRNHFGPLYLGFSLSLLTLNVGINKNQNTKLPTSNIQTSKIQTSKIQVSNLQVKIMRHPETGSARIIMRREKTMRVSLKEDSENGKLV